MTTKFIDKEDEITLNNYKKISDYKWSEGFFCLKCNNEDFYEGARPYSRKCTKCKSDESVTAGTVFHHLRIPLGKALDILFGIMNAAKISINKTLILDNENIKYEGGKLSRYSLIFRQSADKLAKENKVSRKSVWYLLKRIMDNFHVDNYKPKTQFKSSSNIELGENFIFKTLEYVDDDIDLEIVKLMRDSDDIEIYNASSGKEEKDIVTDNLDYINFPSWFRGVRPKNRERYYLLFLMFQPFEFANELTETDEDILLRRIINLTHPNQYWEDTDEFSCFISAHKAARG